MVDSFKEATAKSVLEGNSERVEWQPTQEEKDVIALILQGFYVGTLNQWTPRVEFNDLSLIERFQYDQQLWNTYQPNNGAPATNDQLNGWRSNAMRPIVRNKAISIAAHATARLIFPKVFAYNEESEDQSDSAQVMEDLMEWAADKSDYAFYTLRRVISALSDPASIGYTEYAESYQRVKVYKESGGWEWETRLNPTYSGFQNVPVPVDELLIENFYENDAQKQGFLIWRRVIPYSQAKAKYGSLYENFKYVHQGCQTLYNDANQAFYAVYDPNLRQYDVEEVIYWNKELDVKLILCNGVLLTDYDNPNPRLDKQYPFDKFGYELINNRCFYYKDLSFKLQQDANIINTLYPMVIDRTYLNTFPPTFNTGGEVIGSSVMVPGANVTLSDPHAQLQPIMQAPAITDGMNMLAKVESSVSESSQDNQQSGQPQPGMDRTAYQESLIQQNAQTILNLFIQMIAKHVKDFGELRLGDILQYLTIPEVSQIEGNTKLVYKTFLLHNKQTGGKSMSRKIKFNLDLPNEMTPDEHLQESMRVKKDQGNSKQAIYEVNPQLFRSHTYELSITPDILNPRSSELERAFKLDMYDKLLANPIADQEENLRMLLTTDSDTRKDPDKYISKQANTQPILPGLPSPAGMKSGQPPQIPQPNQPQTANQQIGTLRSPQL